MSDNRGAEFEASIQREAQGRSRSRNLKILRRLVPFMAPYKGMVALATVFLLAAAGASLAIPAAVRTEATCSGDAPCAIISVASRTGL